jgi:glutathione S-transferase
MQLIGMLDSPFVRRTGISLRLLGLTFEHQSVSVFRTFEQFKQINPVVKAPTLVCDDGTVLMDSTLIIDYAEALAGRSLMPAGVEARKQALRSVGLALAACEKAVQIVYEHNLRPTEKWHEPWLTRVSGQLTSAMSALEQEIARFPLSAEEQSMNQAGISAAVAWRFTQEMVPEVVPASQYPRLGAHSAAAEKTSAFQTLPFDG